MDNQMTQNKERVEMIDSNVSFDLQLTFQDVFNNLNCSKLQIAKRFQLIIEQKQNSLRNHILNINNNNLKILHQKTQYFEHISHVNKQQTQQIEIKNKEIQKLTTKIKELTIEIHQLQERLHHQEQKFKNFQSHTLQDYKRLQVIQTKYQQLLNQIENQKNTKNQLQRTVNQLNSNTINWTDRIKYLLQNRQKGLKVQFQQQIAKLKDILFFYQNNNKNLKQELLKQKQHSTLLQQNHLFVITSFQKKYGIQKIPSYENIQVQTFQNSLKRFDVGVGTYAECKQCAKINNLSRHMLNKHVQIQTDKDPRRFTDSESQTVFNFLLKDDEKNLIAKTKDILKIFEKQRQNYESKLNDLETILDNQPSKMEDLKEIRKLGISLSQKDKTIEQLQNERLSLKSLNSILHAQIQSLKLQNKQEKQVRVDSLEFKRKNNTLRLFTEQYPTFASFLPNDEQMFGKTLTLEKSFSKTVDMNTTLLNFKTKRSRMSVYTPERKPKTAKERQSQSFVRPQQDSSHWKNIEKKLKNPQLFSQSPHVNAVRREKYKKFSMMKKKKNIDQQACINFTIAF